MRRLAARLRKPLRPLWISQASTIWTNQVAAPDELPFTPVILVSASAPHLYRRMTSRAAAATAAVGDNGRAAPRAGSSPRAQRRRGGGDGSSCGGEGGGGGGLSEGGAGAGAGAAAAAWSFVYVPGAGDDEESWACSLTPAVFWEHRAALLAAGPHGVRSEARRLALLRRGGGGGGGGSGGGSGGGIGGADGGARPCAEWLRERALAPRPAHALAPRGCEAAAGAVALVAPMSGSEGGAAAFFPVGATGILLGGAAAVAACPPAQLWRRAGAVLCLGARLPPALAAELRAARPLAVESAPAVAAAGPIAIGSPRASCGRLEPGSAGSGGAAGSPRRCGGGASGRGGGSGGMSLLESMLRRTAGSRGAADPNADGADGASGPCGSLGSDAGSAGSGSSSYFSTCSDDEGAPPQQRGSAAAIRDGGGSSASVGSLAADAGAGTDATATAAPARVLWLPIQSAKKSRTALRDALPRALAFASAHLAAGRSVLVIDDDDGDACVCAAAALLLGCFTAPDAAARLEAALVAPWPAPSAPGAAAWRPPAPVTRDALRHRLSHVMAHFPPGRPSQLMLKQVTKFFELHACGGALPHAAGAAGASAAGGAAGGPNGGGGGGDGQ